MLMLKVLGGDQLRPDLSPAEAAELCVGGFATRTAGEPGAGARVASLRKCRLLLGCFGACARNTRIMLG